MQISISFLPLSYLLLVLLVGYGYFSNVPYSLNDGSNPDTDGKYTFNKSPLAIDNSYQNDGPVLIDGQLGQKLQESQLVEKSQDEIHNDHHSDHRHRHLNEKRYTTNHVSNNMAGALLVTPVTITGIDDHVLHHGFGQHDVDHVTKRIRDTSQSDHKMTTGKNDVIETSVTADSGSITFVNMQISQSARAVKVHCGESAHCQNGAICYNDKCLCKKGFVGKYCQFSTLPRNCHEIYMKNDQPELKTGFYAIYPIGTYSWGGDSHQENSTNQDGAFYASCVWDQEKQRPITVVRHNFPPRTVVRNSDMQDVSFLLQYKYFNEQGLRKLIRDSEHCEQHIKYECINAPLLLSESTWFQSASKSEKFARLGGEDEGMCPSSSMTNQKQRRDSLSTNQIRRRSLRSTSKNRQRRSLPSSANQIHRRNLRSTDAGQSAPLPPDGATITGCACDSNRPIELEDEGRLTNQHAALTKMTFLQQRAILHEGSLGRLTLGDLKCTGLSGSNDVVQFAKTSAHLTTPPWRGRSLSFWFKTSNVQDKVQGQGQSSSSSFILRQKHSTDFDRYFSISIKDGRILVIDFKFNGQEANKIELEPSPSPTISFNDNKWHKVVVERNGGEFIFSLNDHQHVFYTLTPKEESRFSETPGYFDSPLVLGSYPNESRFDGFVGCLQNFIQDGFVYEGGLKQQALTKPDSQVRPGCQSECTKDTCKNGGTCIDDYTNANYRCECPKTFPATVMGANCEHDLNADSDITLVNARHGYVSIMNFTENPLFRDIWLSFKTDQPDALLLYAHDQLYNMLQVHLSGGNRITLIRNHGKSLKTCTIFNAETEFNKMQWIQLFVEYSKNHVILYADRLTCKVEVEGGIDSSISFIDQWDNAADVENVVIPPISPFLPKDATKLEENTILFVGGVPNLGVLDQQQQGGLLLLKERKKRQAVYNTAVPNLLGSLRGLKIGKTPANLRNYMQTSKKYVQIGLELECRNLHCENGGDCAINWRIAEKPARCNCLETSFSGSTCSDGTSLKFDGQQFITYNMEQFLEHNSLPRRRPYDLFTLAFFAIKSSAKTSATVFVENNADQRLLLTKFKFKDDHYLSIVLKNDQLRVSLKLPSRNHHFNFTGNFFDGYRHLILIKFWKDEILMRVDNKEHYRWSAPNQPFILHNLLMATFGGSSENVHKITTKNFIGFISLDTLFHFYTGRYPTVIRPLKDAQDKQHSAYVAVFPPNMSFALSPGANFKPDPTLHQVSSNQMIEPVTAPTWDVQLQTEPYHSDKDPTSTVMITDKGNKLSLILGILVTIILLVILLTLILLCKYCTRGGRSNGRSRPQQLLPPASNNSDLTLTPDDLRKQPERIASEKEPLVGQPETKIPLIESSPRTRNNHTYSMGVVTTPIQTVRTNSPDPVTSRGATPEDQRQQQHNGVLRRVQQRLPPAANDSNNKVPVERKARIASCSEMFVEV